MRPRQALALLAATALVAAPDPTAAQSSAARGYLFRPPVASLTIFGGFARPGAGSDVFAQSFDELTLGRRDFNSTDRGADLAFRVNPRTDIVLSLASTGVRRRSNFRDFVDQDGNEIEQTTRFTRTPIGVGARYYLRDRGRMIGSRAWIPTPLLPYVGATVGGLKYRFSQTGDFIDPGTMNVFRDEFKAEGVAPFLQANAGAGWAIFPALQLTGDVRYTYARGDLGRDFDGFERIDLSSLTTSVGLSIRF